MGDETGISGDRDDKQQPTASQSKRARILTIIAGVALVLIGGNSELIFSHSADGKGMSRKLRVLIVVLAFITGGLVTFAVVETFLVRFRVARGGQGSAGELFIYFVSAWAWGSAAGQFTENRSVRRALHDRYALGFAGIVVLFAIGMFAYVIWAGPGLNPTIVIVWTVVWLVVALVGTLVVTERTASWVRLELQSRIAPVLRNDPAFTWIEIVKDPRGVKLVGSVPKADKKRLQETLTPLIGKRHAADAVRGVRAEGDH